MDEAAFKALGVAIPMGLYTGIWTGLVAGLSFLTGIALEKIARRRNLPSVNGILLTDGTIEVSLSSAADFIAACINKRVLIRG
jgi:hypothetical protein